MTGRDVFIGGAIGPLGEAASLASSGASSSPSRPRVLEGRGADLFMLETFFDLEELADAIAAVRGVSSLPIVALLTFDEDAETLAGVTRRAGGRAARARSTSPRSARTTAPACSPRSTALEQMQAHGRAARGAAEHRPREPARAAGSIYPHATPEYFAEFAAHARDLGAARDRRLLRDDADRDRRDPRRDRRGPAGRATRLDADAREVAVALGEEQRETRLATALREGEFVVSVQLDPPLGGSSRGLLEVAQRARGVGARAVRRRQRQRDRARRDQRADGRRARSSARRASRRSRT